MPSLRRSLIGAVALTAGVLAGVPTHAHAVTLVTAAGDRADPYQRWADRAKAPMPADRLAVRLRACPFRNDAVACYVGQGVWLDYPSRMRPAIRKGIFYHELGHNYEYFMPNEVRQGWFAIMGYPGRWDRWRNWLRVDEQFAEMYALCALGGRAARVYRRRWMLDYPAATMAGGEKPIVGREVVGFAPTRTQTRAMCTLIRSTPVPLEPPTGSPHG